MLNIGPIPIVLVIPRLELFGLPLTLRRNVVNTFNKVHLKCFMAAFPHVLFLSLKSSSSLKFESKFGHIGVKLRFWGVWSRPIMWLTSPDLWYQHICLWKHSKKVLLLVSDRLISLRITEHTKTDTVHAHAHAHALNHNGLSISPGLACSWGQLLTRRRRRLGRCAGTHPQTHRFLSSV